MDNEVRVRSTLDSRIVSVECSFDVHPDLIWRKLGIIEQTAKVGKARKPVRFDPQKANQSSDSVVAGRWVFEDASATGEIRDANLVDFTDRVPSGLICILGDVNFQQLKQQTAVPHSSRWAGIAAVVHVAPKHSTDVPVQATKAQQETEGGIKLDLVDDDPEFISPAEQAGFIQQYLQRALPLAAVKTGSVLICCGRSQVVHQISLGAQGMQPLLRDLQKLSYQKSLFHFCTSFLWCSLDKGDPCPEYFTHHLTLVDRSEGKEVKHIHSKDDDAKKKLIQKERLSEQMSRMVDWLHKGFNPKTDLTADRAAKSPPSRPAVGVVTILFGGGQEDIPFLNLSQDRQMAILVIEGSGGLADMVAVEYRKKLQDLKDKDKDKKTKNGQAEDDEQFDTRNSTKIKGVTDLVNYPLLHLIEKGTISEEVGRLVETCLSGNSLLTTAWRLYATWDRAAHNQGSTYSTLQIVLLVMQIFTTAISILMTFLLLLRDDSTPPTDSSKNSAVEVGLWSLMQFLVIGLPIIVTLVQAVEAKTNPGVKWVRLMTASNELLSEIYQYRTRTGAYSIIEIAQRVRDVKTPEEQLQARIKQISEGLLESDVVGITMPEYCGDLPPPHIRQADTGFGLLNAEDYRKARLTPLQKEFVDQSSNAGRKKDALTVSIYIFGALGTGFAALAAYYIGAFQAFVALTTALVNALTRYLEYSRIEWLQKQYNKANGQLANVDRYCLQMKDTDENRSRMVRNAEDIVMGLIRGKAQQMGDAIVEAKVALATMTKEREDLNKKLLAKTDLDEVAKMKSLGLEDLTLEKLAKAVTDPNGADARNVKAALSQLQQQLAPITEPLKETEAGKALAQMVDEKKDTLMKEGMALVSKADGVVRSAMNMFDEGKRLAQSALAQLPPEVQAIVTDKREREKLLQGLAKGDVAELQQFGCNAFLRIARASKTALLEKLKDKAQKEVLAVMKELAVQEAVDLFFKTLETAMILKDMLIRNAAEAEDFLSEIRAIAQMDAQPFHVLLSIIKSPAVKKKLIDLGEEKTKHLCEEAHRMFDRYIQPIPAVVTFLDYTADTLARVEIEDLISGPEGLELRKCIAELKSLGVADHEALPHAALLALFPAKLQSQLQALTQYQLSRHVRVLSLGTSASRLWTAFEMRYRAVVLSLGEVRDVALTVKEQMVMANQWITQVDINRLSKGALLKKIRAAPGYSPLIGESLERLSESKLGTFLSSLQVAISTTYCGRVVDRLADIVTSFDVKSVIRVEDSENFLSKIAELWKLRLEGDDEFTPKEFENSIGYRELSKRFAAMDHDQLRELLLAMRYVVTTPLRARIVAQIQPTATRLQESWLKEMTRWDLDFLYHLAGCVEASLHWRVPGRSGEPKEQKELDFSSFVSAAADFQLLKGLAEIPEKEHHELLSAIVPDLNTELDAIQSTVPAFSEPMLLSAFEVVCFDLSTVEDIQAFAGFASTPGARLFLTRKLQEHTQQPLRKWIDKGGHPFPEIRMSAAEAGTECVASNTVCYTLFTELVTSAAYRLFLRLCDCLASFDLRDFIQGVVMRHNFTYWVFDVLDLVYDTFSQNAFDPAQRPQQEVLARADELDIDDQITSLLYALTPDQFMECLNTMYALFKLTTLGQFFTQYELLRVREETEAAGKGKGTTGAEGAAIQEGVNARQKLTAERRCFERSVWILKERARMNITDVADLLCYKAEVPRKAYEGRSIQGDRHRLLAPLLRDERAANQMEGPYYMVLFDVLAATTPCLYRDASVKRKLVDPIKQAHAVQESAMANIAQALKHFASGVDAPLPEASK